MNQNTYVCQLHDNSYINKLSVKYLEITIEKKR